MALCRMKFFGESIVKEASNCPFLCQVKAHYYTVRGSLWGDSHCLALFFYLDYEVVAVLTSEGRVSYGCSTITFKKLRGIV